MASLEEINVITGKIVASAIAIHTELGPGLFETVYERVLAKDLRLQGLPVERQRAISFEARGILFRKAFKPDLIVNGLVIVEIKCEERLGPIHYMQLNTYLRLTGCRVGLILNFSEAHLKNGIKRMINGYDPPVSPVSP